MIHQFAKNQNWAKLAPLLSIISTLWLLWFFKPTEPLFWAYINIPLYFFHQTEEHFWPGGFKNYINQIINGLPDGWAYQARVLTEDSELKVDGLAYLINDNLYNSYQKVTQ